MLIVGNGFDLAHGRPTTYVDFLHFLNYVDNIKRVGCHNKSFLTEKLDKDCPKTKNYILSSIKSRKISSDRIWNEEPLFQEIYECLDKNVWYEYFQWIQVKDFSRGKNWVDFESEIRTIIEFLDSQIDDIYDEIPHSQNAFPNCTNDRVNSFWRKLDFTNFNAQNKRNESYKNTYSDLINKSYQDLEKLIRCLEIYLDDCVGKIPISCCSPDIQELKFDSVLSFNYTAIPTDIYPSLTNIHNIHGHAKAERPAAENDMVLGVNEYLEGKNKNVRTNFNLYKKFVQRIIKETGIGYKKTLNSMVSDYKDSIIHRTIDSNGPQFNHVYIFGHSLDITDGDILSEIIRTEGVITTVFYKDKQQQANQIANLSKVLNQDELLRSTVSISPTIIFKKQADMRKL